MARQIVAVGREMKVVLICILVLVAAATGLAYGQAGMSAAVMAVVARAWGEPAALLLCGCALLGIAGVVRRMPSRAVLQRSHDRMIERSAIERSGDRAIG
jgi:hypothetical protein